MTDKFKRDAYYFSIIYCLSLVYFSYKSMINYCKMQIFIFYNLNDIKIPPSLRVHFILKLVKKCKEFNLQQIVFTSTPNRVTKKILFLVIYIQCSLVDAELGATFLRHSF